MSYNNPSAPPPSYDELAENSDIPPNEELKSENECIDNECIENECIENECIENESPNEAMKSEKLPDEYQRNNTSDMEYHLQLQTNPYAYSGMCLTAACAPPLPMEACEIQTQPIVVQPQVIQGTGLIANRDGSYDFGPYPCRVLCPECHKTSQTQIEYKNSGFTHLIAGMLCLLGCCCLAPVPYCIDSCKNSVHHCGECGKYLGTYVNGYSVARYQKSHYRPRYYNKKPLDVNYRPNHCTDNRSFNENDFHYRF